MAAIIYPCSNDLSCTVPGKEAPYGNYKLHPVDEAEALRHKLSLWQLNWFSWCLVALAMIPQINGQSGTLEEDLNGNLHFNSLSLEDVVVILKV